MLGANGSIGEAALLVAEHLGLQATGVTREGTKVLGRDTLTYNDLSATSGESGFNLVIYLEGNSEECIRRSQNRKMDPLTGNIYHLEDNPLLTEDKKIHFPE